LQIVNVPLAFHVTCALPIQQQSAAAAAAAQQQHQQPLDTLTGTALLNMCAAQPVQPSNEVKKLVATNDAHLPCCCPQFFPSPEIKPNSLPG
jgi:hypothetical protein